MCASSLEACKSPGTELEARCPVFYVAQAHLKHAVALLTSFFKHFLYVCVSVGEYCHSMHVEVIGQLTGIAASHRVCSRGMGEHVYPLRHLTAPHLLKNKTKNSSNIRNSFHPYTLPHISERYW